MGGVGLDRLEGDRAAPGRAGGHQTCDVAVVGGGPAGTAAAITLARAGRDVVLVDKALFPRDKTCGDGLTTGALRRLESLGLRPADVASWQPAAECAIRSPSGRTIVLPLGDGVGRFAAIARRADLDAALLDLARTAGVKVLDGHECTGAWTAPGQSAVRIAVDGTGDVLARYVIGADGMWSPLRKALGVDDADGYLGEWHAFRQYFADVGPQADKLWVWFDEDLLPGYAWSFPLPGGRANVGYGLLRRPDGPHLGGRTPLGKRMKELWPRLLERPHIADVLGPAASPESPHKAWPIPARIGATRLSACGGRVLFVGDAARATDPMTGEGIGQALETGQLAAEAVLRAGALHPWQAQARYEHEIRTGLAVDMRLAGLLSKVVARPAGIRGAVRIAGATAWTRRNFGRWLFEDYPRAALVTPSRWHRGMFGGAGAYR